MLKLLSLNNPAAVEQLTSRPSGDYTRKSSDFDNVNRKPLTDSYGEFNDKRISGERLLNGCGEKNDFSETLGYEQLWELSTTGK